MPSAAVILSTLRFSPSQGLFTLSKSFNDESEVDKSEKDNIEFVETGKEVAEALQQAKEQNHLQICVSISGCGK
jgi:hypothetical protein